MNYNVGAEDAGKRLDIFLTTKLEGVSRSAIQKLIKGGTVLVNEKKVSVHHFLHEGDVVAMEEKKKTTVKVQKIKEMPPVVLVVYEDDDVLVVEKPSGLLVHPAPGITGATLVDFLVSKYPKIKKVGDDPTRPGIVHRLDRDVSGLMVVAKNQKSFENLKKQFANREVIKEYAALVTGEIKDNTGIIKFKIGRSKNRARMAGRPESQEGKEAITEFEVIKRFANATLLKVRILTGRTHQIRAHFHALGHPVSGDTVYNIKGIKMRIPLSRPFLHAEKLGFMDLSGKSKEFTSPLPKELEEYLTKLKSI